MGCGASNNQQSPINIPLQNQVSPPSQIVKKKSPPKQPQENRSKNAIPKKTDGKIKDININQSTSSLRNMRSSTKTIKKQQRKQVQSDKKSIHQTYQRRMSLSPSKIKLNVQQIEQVNEQQVQNINQTERKKRKIKRRQTELDSRINQLIKIYGL